MSATCQVHARKRARSAIDDLEACPAVVTTDLLSPSQDPTDRWTLEIVLDTEGIPAVVNAILGQHGLTTREAAPRGSHWLAVAVVDR